jgi:putative hydrolase
MGLKIETEDTKCGDFHVHTNYTDGENTIRDYCEAAEKNGLKAIAFTEHVRKNLSYDYRDFLFDIQNVRREYKGLKVLSGCEAKVLNVFGDLDVHEQILDECDVVIGVFHSYAFSGKMKCIMALEAMLANPAVDIWGHPTLFANRNRVRLSESELDRILDLCKDENVLIERNLKYHVPNSSFLRMARRKGAGLILGSDAHSIHDLLTQQELREQWKWIKKMC